MKDPLVASTLKKAKHFQTLQSLIVPQQKSHNLELHFPLFTFHFAVVVCEFRNSDFLTKVYRQF